MDIYKIYCDGGARGNPGPGASAIVVESNGKIIFKKGKYLGKVTNNIAEYGAAIMALSWIEKNIGIVNDEKISLIFDSELVAKQLSGIYKIKNENLKILFTKAKSIEKMVGGKINYYSVPRNKNKLADFMVNKALDENINKFHVPVKG